MKHTITYEGHQVGDMVWIWVGWCHLLTQVKILGMTLWYYEDEPDKCHPDYTVKFIDSNGELQTYTFQEDDVYDTRKEAIEAAIKEEETDLVENKEMLQRQEFNLDWLKRQFAQEVEDASER